VQKALLEGIATVVRAGKAAGILMADKKLAQSYIDAGALFVAVGVDTTLLVRAATELAASFARGAARAPADTSAQPY
jgi:4-hydroxy-2-oxoheptanedioate aldolase